MKAGVGEEPRLILHFRHDLGVRVPDVQDTNTTGKVDEAISVYILDDRPRRT
jgi:hypothetical protein